VAWLRVLLVGAVLIHMLGAAAGSAEETATGDEDEAPGWLLLPVVAYSPETSVMLGASGLRFFQLDEEAESSVFSPVAIGTFKEQILVFLGGRLEWQKDRVEFLPSYKRFPDLFFGIGRDVRDEDEEDYTPEAVGIRAAWLHEFAPDLRVGPGYELQSHRLKEIEEDGLLASGAIFGTEKILLSLPGLQVDFDTRDSLWSPRSGWWLNLTTLFSRDTFGSDADFDSYSLDLRGYRPVGDQAVLAFQLQGISLDGDVPFFMMPTLGGQEGMRGYLEGRYRHRTRALGRVEYRSGQTWGRFGWVAFAGIGDVADGPDDLSLTGKLWSFGGGLRYTLDETEGVKLRLDIGRGNGDGGFFISFGEAF